MLGKLCEAVLLNQSCCWWPSLWKILPQCQIRYWVVNYVFFLHGSRGHRSTEPFLGKLQSTRKGGDACGLLQRDRRLYRLPKRSIARRGEVEVPSHHSNVFQSHRRQGWSVRFHLYLYYSNCTIPYLYYFHRTPAFEWNTMAMCPERSIPGCGGKEEATEGKRVGKRRKDLCQIRKEKKLNYSEWNTWPFIPMRKLHLLLQTSSSAQGEELCMHRPGHSPLENSEMRKETLT